MPDLAPPQRPRILLVSTSYLPLVGGSEVAIRETTRQLMGYDFDIITFQQDATCPPLEKEANTTIYRVGRWLGRIPFPLPKSFLPLAIWFAGRRLIRQHRYVAIHAYQASQAAGGAWLLKKEFPRIPFVITVQEGKDLDRQSWLVKFFRGQIIRAADQVVVISKHLAEKIKTICPLARITVIPNGVSPKFLESHPRMIVRDRYQIFSEEFVIITVSRLVHKNGLDILLRSCADIGQPFRILIVGTGPEESQLRALAEELDIAKSIVFAGLVPTDRIPEYLAAADLFVRPSRSEGLGNAFLEAMAAGVPVIGTPVGGIPDFLFDGQTGLLCAPDDPHDLGQKIKKIRIDPTLRSHVIQNAHALVTRVYMWPTIAQQVENVYHSLA